MYIFFSILALLCSAAMVYLDQTVLKRVTLKFHLFIKSAILLLFALFLLAASQSFDKLLDFIDAEWLYFVIMLGLSFALFYFYNLSVKEEKLAHFSVLRTSLLLIFVNIFFLIFSIDSILHNKQIPNIIFVVIEMLALLGVTLISLLNKENNKGNMLKIGIFTLALAGMLIIKKTLLVRQGFEIIFFWGAVTCFVASTVMLFVSKTERKALKTNNKWQNYLLILMGTAAMGLVYILADKSMTYVDAKLAIINMIIGFSFVGLLVLDLVVNLKQGMKFQDFVENNGVLLVNSLLLSIGLVSYSLASLL